MNKYIDASAVKINYRGGFYDDYVVDYDSFINAPSIDIVFCKECKHRPIKEDANGKNYGFNLIEPTEDDGRCPCLVADGWYSWMPKDDFYCGYGERENE